MHNFPGNVHEGFSIFEKDSYDFLVALYICFLGFGRKGLKAGWVV